MPGYPKMTLQNEVNVIFNGYSRDDPEDSKFSRANCSCTLVRCNTGRHIIVDTMTCWDSERLLSSLKWLYCLNPNDIYAVINTHGHSDHTGCNYLFTNAHWHIVGQSVSNGDRYLKCPLSMGEGPFVLSGDDVTVELTPGHTLDSVSVVVRNTEKGIVGICGDLFERVEDINDPALWLEAGSEDPHMQRKQRLRMAEMCDSIVPGHGDEFTVTPQMIEILRKQLLDSETTVKGLTQ